MELKTFVWTETDSEGYGDTTLGEFKDNEIDLSDDEARRLANDILLSLRNGEHVTFRID
ncbi:MULTISPECIES: hypothetical protein [Leuconostoc]|uniref:hypothetical protein n=1 Tax=Leuconostoc TaxID=1243 RepID=UPI0021AA2541|nr:MULTISPECIES: hypothetical protein [Leuconostoc]NLT85121.1 hypothetical protein [Leuconostoc sp.]